MNTARIFVFGLDHVIAAEEVKGKKVHRVKVGGWSQARYQRRVGNAHAEHAKEVMERLAQIVREDKISHIVLAGDSVVIALLQEQLHQEMNSTVEVMKLDIHASEHDVLAATLEKLQEQEATTAAEKVDRLMQQYRARGLAVAGIEETLEALARHYKILMNDPWEDLPKKARDAILHGSGDEVIRFIYDDGVVARTATDRFHVATTTGGAGRSLSCTRHVCPGRNGVSVYPSSLPP